MTLFRVYAGEDGETHLARLELPLAPASAGPPRRAAVADVPTTTLGMSELLEPKPDSGLHRAPRRQLVVVLRGEMEVVTSTGASQRLGAGDCLLAEDVDGNGHHTRETGDEPLSTLNIGIDPGWTWPGT